MKKILTIVMIILINRIFAYDFSMINLINPSGLRTKQGELMIRHRFYGDITDAPLDNFLGMDEAELNIFNAQIVRVAG